MITLLAYSLTLTLTPSTEDSRTNRIPVWIVDYIMGLSSTWMENEQRAALASHRAGLDL